MLDLHSTLFIYLYRYWNDTSYLQKLGDAVGGAIIAETAPSTAEPPTIAEPAPTTAEPPTAAETAPAAETPTAEIAPPGGTEVGIFK